MDGSVREPVTAQSPVSLFTPPSIACGDIHVAESGGDTSALQAFPDSIPFPVQVVLRGLRDPQTTPATISPGAEGQPHSLEAPFKFLAAATGHCSETKDLGGTSRLSPWYKQALQGDREAPGAPLPENNQAMPRAAAPFSFQEKDAAEPPATDGSHSPPSRGKTGLEACSVLSFAEREQQGTATTSTGCCFVDNQQQGPRLSPRVSPSPAADGIAADAAAAAAATASLTVGGHDVAEAASRLTSQVTLTPEVHPASAGEAEAAVAMPGMVHLPSVSTSKACVVAQCPSGDSPYCRIESMNGSTYAAHEDEGGSQSLPSPGIDWADAGAGATPPDCLSDDKDAAVQTDEACGADDGAAAHDGLVFGEGRRAHRSGRVSKRSHSGRHFRMAASASGVQGAPAVGETRRRADGRTGASARRGKSKRRSNTGRDGRKHHHQQQQQPQPLRLTSEILLQLEARTSRRASGVDSAAFAAAGVESTAGTSDTEAATAGGLGGSSMSFFWLVKQRAEQTREAAGDARRLAAFQRAERMAEGSGATEGAVAAAAAAAEVDDCSSQSQRSSELSTKGTVNHRCREDDVRINLCENPSDLWYGLKTQDGNPVVVHSRPRHHSRRHHRQRRPPMAETSPAPTGPMAAAVAHQQAAAALYHHQRMQQQMQQQMQMQQQHALGLNNRPLIALTPPEQQQHRQQQRRHQRHRSHKDPMRRHGMQRSSSQLPSLAQGLPAPSFLQQQQHRQRGSTASWQHQQGQTPQQQFLMPQQQQQFLMPQQQQQVPFQQQMQQQQPLPPPQQQMPHSHRADRKRRHRDHKRGLSSSSSAAATSAAAGTLQQQQQNGAVPQQQQLFPSAPSKETRRSERRRRFLAGRTGDTGQHAAFAVQQQNRQSDRVVFVHSPEAPASSSSSSTRPPPPCNRLSGHHQPGLPLPPSASSAQPWAQQNRSFRGPPLRVSSTAENAGSYHQPQPPFVAMGAGQQQQQHQQQQSGAVGGETSQLHRPARRQRLDDGTADFAAATPTGLPVGTAGGRGWNPLPTGGAAAAAAPGVFKPPAPLSASQKASAKRRGLGARYSISEGIAEQSVVGPILSYPPMGGPEDTGEAGAPPSLSGMAAASAGPSSIGSSGSSSGQQQQQQQHSLPAVARPVPSYGDLDATERMAQQQPFKVVLGATRGVATVVTDATRDVAATGAAPAANQMIPRFYSPAPVQAKQSRRMTARERVQWQLAKSRGML